MKIAAVATALLVGTKAINMAPESMIEIQNKLKAQSGAASLSHHHEDHHHHHHEEVRVVRKVSKEIAVTEDKNGHVTFSVESTQATTLETKECDSDSSSDEKSS